MMNRRIVYIVAIISLMLMGGVITAFRTTGEFLAVTNPTEQQQTIDAAVQQILAQTATAQPPQAATQTAQAATSQPLTMTVMVEAALQQALAATAYAQYAVIVVETHADWTPVERDFDGVMMVLVPAGSFEMGSTADQIDAAVAMCQQSADNNATCERLWYDDELIPAAGNTQSMTPFWIDKTEVTRAMYQRCLDAGACDETPASDYSTEPDQPINNVTWFQAQTYCEWRGARLPTEAEWEYAARGPDGLIFPWGNDFDGTRANHCDRNCGEASWASGFNYVNEENDDGYAVTAPVGSYPAGVSWVGALDMSGNVWEWVSSLYRPYPYNASDGREDDANRTGVRVLRGGSFDNSSFFLHAATRDRNIPAFGLNDLGFRCARSR